MPELKVPFLNNVRIVGRLTMEPELRYTPSGAAVLQLHIAVNRRYQDKKTQEWKDDASFFVVNQWGQAAERNAEKFKKGDPVLIDGRLRSRSWEKDGKKSYAVEVVAMSIQSLVKRETSGEASGQPSSGDQPGETPPVPADMLDDVPF